MQEQTLANPELAQVEIEEMSRSDVLMKGVLAAGAVYGLSMVGPFLRQAFAQSGSGDVDILNFALTLEYLEAAFYDEAKSRVKANGDVMSTIDLLAKDEAEHVEALEATIKQLGGMPVTAPKVKFPYSNTIDFLKLAVTFEDTGVSAYNGAAPMIKSKELLATAGGIVQVEARHAGAVRLLAGESPSPQAFDPTLTEDEVLAAVQPFVQS
jgi:rubrerythrin